MKCAICGGDAGKYGNNPDPILDWQDRVCNTCNDEIIIPARMGRKYRITTCDGRVLDSEAQAEEGPA